MAKEETKETKKKFGLSICKTNKETGEMEPIDVKKKIAVGAAVVGGIVLGSILYCTKRGGSNEYNGPIDVPYEEVDQ